MKAIVFTSGGLMSWEAGRRAQAKYGAENTIFLFTDTKIESPDLYAFLRASMQQTNARFEWIAEGRTPFEVFRDEGSLARNPPTFQGPGSCARSTRSGMSMLSQRQ